MEVQVAFLRSGKSNIAVIDSDIPQDSRTLTELMTHIYAFTLKSGYPTTKVITAGSLFRSNKSMQFFQYIPGRNGFDSIGNCGNALIAAYVYLLCYKGAQPATDIYSSHSNFAIQIKSVRLVAEHEYTLHAEMNMNGNHREEVLPLHEAVSNIKTSKGNQKASVVHAGNPYVWVEASSISDKSLSDWTLPELASLIKLRTEFQPLLGIPAGSVFPKIAAFRQIAENRLTLRMISVEDWHPSFAVTGMLNLAVALQTPGTILNQQFRETGGPVIQLPDRLIIPKFRPRAIVIEQNVKYVGGITIELENKIVV